MLRTRKLLEKCIHTGYNLNFFESLNEFNKKNMNYFDRLELTVNNPKNVSRFSVFRTHIFNCKIFFSKNELAVTKEFNNNNLSSLLEDVNKFINSEIKI